MEFQNQIREGQVRIALEFQFAIVEGPYRMNG